MGSGCTTEPTDPSKDATMQPTLPAAPRVPLHEWGARVARARRDLGLSQSELAAGQRRHPADHQQGRAGHRLPPRHPEAPSRHRPRASPRPPVPLAPRRHRGPGLPPRPRLTTAPTVAGRCPADDPRPGAVLWADRRRSGARLEARCRVVAAAEGGALPRGCRRAQGAHHRAQHRLGDHRRGHHLGRGPAGGRPVPPHRPAAGDRRDPGRADHGPAGPRLGHGHRPVRPRRRRSATRCSPPTPARSSRSWPSWAS